MAGAFRLRVKIIASLLLTLIVVQVINSVVAGQLGHFGILPRNLGSWYHIFTAPFVHNGYGHLFSNLMGLTVFGAICLARSVSYFAMASAFIIVVSGALVWLFGRQAIHVGASGWIFGLWSLSIVTAWFDSSLKNIGIAVLVIFFYGGMIYGLLPAQSNISFEAHIFGALSGVGFAAIVTRSKTTEKVLL